MSGSCITVSNKLQKEYASTMATSNPQTSAEKTEEEMQLEEFLQSVLERKKVLFEMTKEADEQLRKIRQEEEKAREILLQKRAERVEREQRERHAAGFHAPKKTKERELQAELKIVKTENHSFKQQVAALNDKLKKLKENLQRTTRYSKTQLKEKREKDEAIHELTQRVKCMEDEDQLREAELNVLRTITEHQDKSLAELRENLLLITSLSRDQEVTIKSQKDKILAFQQIAIETQMRQLDELESLTEEKEQLKQALTSLYRQQQSQLQQPTAEEHRRGKCVCASSNFRICGYCK